MLKNVSNYLNMLFITALLKKKKKLLILYWDIADYGEGNNNILQYSWLENSRDRGA